MMGCRCRCRYQGIGSPSLSGGGGDESVGGRSGAERAASGINTPAAHHVAASHVTHTRNPSSSAAVPTCDARPFPGTAVYMSRPDATHASDVPYGTTLTIINSYHTIVNLYLE